MPTGTLDAALLRHDRPHRAAVAVRAAHPHALTEAVASSVPSAPVHPVLRLQHLHGNRHVQRLIQEQRGRPPQIARKAAGGGACPSAPSEEEAAQAQAQQAQAQGQEGPAVEEETVMAKSIYRSPEVRQIQRYGLVGFPKDEKEKMEAAIPVALDTVEDCDDVGWFKTKAFKDTLRSTFYVYDPEMDLCGWTFPLSKVIKIGKPAFRSTCCKLESTLAHEAAHVSFSTESGARELEKDCFGCRG